MHGEFKMVYALCEWNNNFNIATKMHNNSGLANSEVMANITAEHSSYSVS